ncbi:MAG: hypothetical protein Q9184_004139 [Pyrenodesmia sp. 2 TL-2023]
MTTTSTTTAADWPPLFDATLLVRDVPYYDDPLLQAFAYEQHLTAYIKLLESREEYFAALAIGTEVQSLRDGYERLAKETGAMIRKAYAWEKEVRLEGIWLAGLDLVLAMGGVGGRVTAKNKGTLSTEFSSS